MCGIISIKGKNAVKKTIAGLKKLEYRGYDSCGIAWKNKKLNIKKSKGYISILEEKVKNIKSELTIGHTRWATHGVPSELNSHPHVSMDGKFMCVHNGIIENYKELKKQYLQGYEFYSETDTEVIPNLVSKFYKDLVCSKRNCRNRKCNSKCGGNGCNNTKCKCSSVRDDILTAFKMAIDKLKGSFAIVLINDYNDKIYFARHSSPMVISKTQDMIICSDINGLDDKSNAFYLPDDTYGVLDNDFEVFDTNSNPIVIKYSNYKGGIENKLGNYKHYMLKEIYEIPSAIDLTKNALSKASLMLPKDISQILFVSCGTSYHASLMAKKYIENFAHIPCECVIASEFVSSNNLILPNTLGVFISQSGETADTLKSLEKAKSQGVYTLAITNVQNSHITLMADTTVLMRAGAEICVASTKAYTTQLFVLLQLTNYLINLQQGNFKASAMVKSTKKDKVAEEGIFKSNTSVGAPELVEVIAKQDCLGISSDDISNLIGLDISAIDKQLDNLIDKIYLHKQFHLIGKDYDYITAMEGSLKIKEISYIFTDAYPCGELKHGTLSLIDENSIVFVIMTERDLIAKTTNAIHEITSRGGNVVCITQFDDIDLSDCYYVIRLPKLNQLFMPIVSIIPFHLISYKITTKLGLNPDKPRNLAKSVTVE